MTSLVPRPTFEPAPPFAAAAASRARPRQRGFTLVETLVAVGIAGVLSSIAYPSLSGHLSRARRADALVALLQAQLAQERFRADHASYGNLADIGVRSTSTSGFYSLTVDSADTAGYRLVATATGAQARDTTCRTLRLEVTGSAIAYTSGADAATANAADINRRCWNR